MLRRFVGVPGDTARHVIQFEGDGFYHVQPWPMDPCRGMPWDWGTVFNSGSMTLARALLWASTGNNYLVKQLAEDFTTEILADLDSCFCLDEDSICQWAFDFLVRHGMRAGYEKPPRRGGR